MDRPRPPARRNDLPPPAADPDVGRSGVGLDPRGILLGDGATAAVLDTTRRPLTIAAVASSGRPDAELQFFADFAPGNPIHQRPHGKTLRPEAIPAMRACITTAVTQALDQAGLAPGDPRIRAVAFTRLGRTLLRRVFYPALPTGLPRPLQLTADTGHLGAGDLLANLAHIHHNIPLTPGDYALIVNIAMGFTTTAVIIQANGR
ncbi:hypothetical protein [Nocardia wallacei]|uniref:hypothetical protein n=1 Tax=Nocardia wallacei TaxID=480035 RepID=UPI00245506B3|nr:hypothetical protein [Nocardia wallacei]